MKIVSESNNLESKELLSQVLLRIFSVCKTDPGFPLKEKLIEIEGEIDSLKTKLIKQDSLLTQSSNIRQDLDIRIKGIEEKNFDIKSRLLEELGSEV